METQLFFDLTAKPPRPSVFFRESEEVEHTLEDLRKRNIAVFEIDGLALSSTEDLFKAFAIALRKPAGWCGDEEYPNNWNAFLEYLDDVVEWVPAEGHVVLIRGSKQLWCNCASLAGNLVEWWQSAGTGHQAMIRLVFVW